MYQDLSTRHDWPVKEAIVDLPIRLEGNSLPVIIESVEGQEQGPQRYSCLFRKRSLPFLRHLGNLWPVS